VSIEIKGNHIVFSSHRKSLPTVLCKLVALFICPSCHQILKAFFETEEPVPWLKYEGAESEWDSRFESIAVPGGQGLVNKRHGSYSYECSLEIFWAPNPKTSLQEWLEKYYRDYQLKKIEDVIQQVKSGKIPGLLLVDDQINGTDHLLGYDKKAFAGEWDCPTESYEEWEKRSKEKEKQIAKLLGLSLTCS
jgi:hypothetical protein